MPLPGEQSRKNQKQLILATKPQNHVLSPQIGPAVCSPGQGGEPTAAARGAWPCPTAAGLGAGRHPPPSGPPGELLGQSWVPPPGKGPGFLPARTRCCPGEILPAARQQFPQYLEDAERAVQRARRDSPWQPSHPTAARRRSAPSARRQQPNTISDGTTRAEPNASNHSNPTRGGIFIFAPSRKRNTPLPPNPGLQKYGVPLARSTSLTINVCTSKNKGHSWKGQT